MSESLDRFVNLLLRAEIITASQLQTLRQQVSTTGKAAADEDIVQRLADSGQLTAFQVAEVRQGKAEHLVVGDYLILDPVGRGGMGQVFKARHAVMKREVAVKFILTGSDGTTDQASMDRFQREVEAASKLSHPNIVSALDAGRRGDVCYLVMEYVRGKNLAQFVRENGPMSFRQALDCTLQAAQALEYAHSKGVVHRDIKPSNLLLTTDGQIKLLDMGLVRNAYDNASDQCLETTDPLTHSGQLLGTVDFMAPEQALDPRSSDRRADIYSLGCTLYFLLTGKLPFRNNGNSAMSRVIAHREAPIPSICAARPDVPAEFERTFEKMLAKQVHQRYQTVTELIADLRKAQFSAQVANALLTDTETMTQGVAKKPSRKAGRSALGGILLSLAFVLGVFWFSRPQPAPVPSAAPQPSSASEGPAPITGPVNLLGNIDLAQHVVMGTPWKISEGKLSVPPSVPSKLCVPVAFPPAFRLDVTVKRTSGEGPLILGMREEGRSFFVLIDAKRDGGAKRMTGLGSKADRMVTRLDNALLMTTGEPLELRLLVGANTVSLEANAKTVFEWQGDFRELSLGSGWSIGKATGLLVGSNDRGSFEISHLELIPDNREVPKASDPPPASGPTP